jgi:hypothetical protein
LLGKKPKLTINVLENIFLALVFGGIAPIFFFLAGWWGAYFFDPESQIPVFMLAGLGLGIIIDLLFLGKWIKLAYRIHPIILIAIYLFYSVGIFGFFMGVPVFNIVMGPLAGFYIGRKMGIEKINSEEKERIIHWTGLFTSFVLAVACLAALVLAASESTLAANINGMLHDMIGLKSTFDNQTLLILSALAGVGIVVVEYYLTQAVAKKAILL